jgi:hypothetical protein
MEGIASRTKSKKRRSKKSLLTGIAIVAFTLASAAKTTKLTGKMVGYDVIFHLTKAASFVQNQEVVALETSNLKEKYDTTQIEQKYFDGSQPLEVDVFRDHSCDEDDPTFVTQVSLEHIARTYLLTDAYKPHPPARIKTLKCYVAIYKKKK